MAPRSLNDVRELLKKGEDLTTGPYSCAISSYATSAPWPRRFMYRGCAHMNRNNLCGKSIEHDPDPCGHQPSLEGNYVYLFRFDLLLTDANVGGSPLRACIFDAARQLLDVSTDDFRQMDKDEQIRCLHSATTGNPLVNVWIRTAAQKRCIVVKMDRVIALDSPPGSPTNASPIQYFTPPSTMRTSSRLTGIGASSSSSTVTRSAGAPRGFLNLDEPDVQRNLAKAIEFLASLSTSDLKKSGK